MLPKSRGTSRKANAIGFAKRQARRVKTVSGLSDVYDYQPTKTRRSKVSLDLSKHEAAEFRSGHDDEQSDHDRLRARLVGENGDDDKIDSDDDEEIDSDAAFEDTDDDRFAGFSFETKGKSSSKSSRNVRFADVDLNENGPMDLQHDSESNVSGDDDEEDDDEEEDGDPDEFIDVLDVLDGRGEPEDDDAMPSAPVGHSNTSQDVVENEDDREYGDANLDQDESSGSEDASVVEDEEDVISGSDADDPEALHELDQFITTLDPTSKRKAPQDGDPEPDASRPRKRRFLKDRTEAGAEHEFGVQASGSTKLKINDLLAPLASQSSALLALKNSTKVLSSAKGVPLSAPLPQRTQERLDRSAAYEQTKEEIDNWKATMKRIREAEHLSFPLQSHPVAKTSNLELAAKFKPSTELETSIDKLLKSAKMREEDIEQTEQLKMNHLSVEEVAARRAELRKMRELMFRAEVKAKRVAKIKSKTYRRIQRKEREKAGDVKEGEDDDDEEGRMKKEVERARERATLRHKNTGKWARSMKARSELDVDQRKEIGEMLERGERLRKKIHGEKGSDVNDDDSEDDGDDEGEDGDAVTRAKASAFEELAKVKSGSTDPREAALGKNSIFEMKFMKDAMARENQEADKMADDFIREMGGRVGSDDDLPQDGEADNNGAVAVERTGGRVAYRPGPMPSVRHLAPQESQISDTSSVTLKSSNPPSTSPVSQAVALAPAASTPKSNPWLLAQDSGTKVARKKNEVVVGKDSSAAEKSKNRLKKGAKKRTEEKEKERDDAVVEISMDNVMTIAANIIGEKTTSTAVDEMKRATKVKSAASDSLPQNHEDDSDHNSEAEVQEQALQRKGGGKGNALGTKAFARRDLVALAFAGDHVVQDFKDAKQREIRADAPREEDTTLAGWGSWGGSGTRRQPTKPHLIKKVAGIDPKTRADFNKSHVIISEKKDKKAAKYLVKDLPYPYTSKAQFERSIDTPIGTEWNTRVGFQRGTLPRIVKKMGTVIEPLEKLV